MKIDELVQYKELIAMNKGEEPFFNCDRAHNAIVMAELLARSNVVKMFCGSFSLYGKNFKDYVYEEYGITGTEVCEIDPMGSLYEKTSTFLSKGGRMEVIIEHPNKNFWDEPVYIDIFKNYVTNGQVKFFKVAEDAQKEDLDICHFAIGDHNMYRNEINKDRHFAIVNFNDENGAKSLSRYYDVIKHDTVPFTPSVV